MDGVDWTIRPSFFSRYLTAELFNQSDHFRFFGDRFWGTLDRCLSDIY